MSNYEDLAGPDAGPDPNADQTSGASHVPLEKEAGEEFVPSPDTSDVGGKGDDWWKGQGSPPPPTPPTPPTPPLVVQLSRPDDGLTPDTNLWTLIRSRTRAIAFNNYVSFMDDVISGQPRVDPDTRAPIPEPESVKRAKADVQSLAYLGPDSYDVLHAATELFLMHEAGIIPDPARQNRFNNSINQEFEWRYRNRRVLGEQWVTQIRDEYYEALDRQNPASPRALPYMRLILERLRDLETKSYDAMATDTYGILPGKVAEPLALELIWSYWHEEGLLVQAFNAISNRFQNKRNGPGPDPLARLEIDPLRRLNNFIWGWIQAEPFRLSVRRRAYEYDHHYGITLVGSAVGKVEGADSRRQFLAAFHNLLHLCTTFYQQDDDLTVHADGFPLLNALRETQLVLTAGAHNQYGDLPWTSRIEMMMQLWMLSRPEMREFLGGRIMVPYKEGWMDRVDSVRLMMGWDDTNITHFRDLGVFGEQVLLSIRYGSWATVIDPTNAVNWARYWRPEVQGYIEAYRAATGVELRQGTDTTMPGQLLRQRELARAQGRR